MKYFKKYYSLYIALLFFLSVSIITSNTNYNNLTKSEYAIIINKNTEKAYSGLYYNFFENGIYYCKQCNQALYNSNTKFEANCGWPSFDDEINGSISYKLDLDGIRTEILCSNCNGHLGHYFIGENYTVKDVRHSVNSLSLNFEKNMKTDNINKAYYAGGCFWGLEYLFEKLDGVLSVKSGYMGGFIDNPTYKQICYEKTGHLEAVEVEYNTDIINYRNLTKYFFEIHDPTQINGQGPDIGDQYLSAIFFKNEEEEDISKVLIEILIDKSYKIATRLIPYKTFWIAENYHQNYYKKQSGSPYCHSYQKRF